MDEPTNMDVQTLTTPDAGEPAAGVQPDGGAPTTPPTVDDPAVDEGKVTRLQQQMSKQNRVMEALGIDPSSDLADKFSAGLITRDELLQQAGMTYRNAPTTPQPLTAPMATPEATQGQLDAILEKMKTGGVYSDDLAVAFGEQQRMIKELNDKLQTRDQRDNMGQCLQVVDGVLSGQEMHSSLPDSLKQVEREMFLSSTDSLLASESPPDDPYKYANPQGYAYFANRNAARMQQLRDHYINIGRQQAGGTPVTPARPAVAPISPSQGGSPQAAPAPRVTRENMKDMARKYMAQKGIQV